MAKTAGQILATPLVVPALVVLALAAIAVVVLYVLSANTKKPKRRSRASAASSTAAGTVKVQEDGNFVRRSTRSVGSSIDG